MVHWDAVWSLHKRASNMEPSTRLGGFEQQTPLISIGVGTNSIWDWGGAERNIHCDAAICDAAICAACMNINKVLRLKYWGGGSYTYDKLLVVFMDQANISESLCFEAPENPQVV